ncbi:hypothetical protein [Nitrincola alkalilacustris]|uniref:hypothetical protein n=1 Tax=Nitrincola alkalilacustris TaxID=1571224 RepID=UPI001980339F|nr:hypothetical protein [Nitrincola alkalilacustris]
MIFLCLVALISLALAIDMQVASEPPNLVDSPETTYQATPLKIGDTLYLCTPQVALDADHSASAGYMMLRCHRKSNVSTRPAVELPIYHQHPVKNPPLRSWM